MPTYQYYCTECGHELEAVQKFSEDSLTVCPECAGLLRKRFSAVGVVFKGSGFYSTDNRKHNGSKSSGDGADGSRNQEDGGSKDNNTSDGSDSAKQTSESASADSPQSGSSAAGTSDSGAAKTASNGSSRDKTPASSGAKAASS
jgi:putative FmdB family regulatory protein